MESFIERMFEREKCKAKKRIQKYAGQDGERWRSSLKNVNALLKQIDTDEKKQISSEKFDGSPRSKKTEADTDLSGNLDSFSKSNDHKVSNPPEEVKSTNIISSFQVPSKTEFKGLPKTLAQPSNLVSNKILIFEAKDIDKKMEHSSQTSFAEKRAIFEQNAGFPIAVRNSHKIQCLNTVTDIKPIHWCPPKPGYLYPDLSMIKITECNNDAKYIVDSTDKKSITTACDEKIETEIMKTDYYVQNNRTDNETESDLESIQNTSFGRSIIQALNELSLCKKPESSIESDSITMEYSVLDEMNQSLHECLSIKELDNDDVEEEDSTSKVNTNSESLVKADESNVLEEKIKKLSHEIYMQEKIIGGANKALNFIHSTNEFIDSNEHVEGEWALLIAIYKQQAAMNEIQRLKRESTLRSVKADLPEVQGRGSLTISAITLLLNQEYFSNTSNTYLHCVCLMSHLGEVVATQTATAKPGDSCIRFTSTLKFDDLPNDFRINVEVYSLQTQPKCLPHEKKYHIGHKTRNKSAKRKNQFKMLDVESPTKPVAIRSPAFQLMGTAIITLSDVNCEQFILFGISSHSPLKGHLNVHISSKPLKSVEHRGFLTLFEDIANFGNWRRRWYLLKNARLYYWEHPEDEDTKNSTGSLDLKDVFTKKVQFINGEKYTRPFTFLLETSRPAQPGDVNSLVMKTNGIETTIQHFLIADAKEGSQWISKLNKTLDLIRTWGPFKDSDS